MPAGNRKSDFRSQNRLVVAVMLCVGVVDAVEYKFDPFNVETDLRKDGVLEWIAKEGRLSARAETDDSLDFPGREVA